MAESMLFIDPGEATGWSLWAFTDDAPLMRLEWGLIPGGLDGFLDWAELHIAGYNASVWCEDYDALRGGQFKNFTPLEIKGALKAICRALAIPLEFQGPDMKVMCRDEDLKRLGLWVENDEVDWEDARDVNDTQRHALARMKATGHLPTVLWAWPDV